MPALINPLFKTNHCYVSDENPLIILVSVIMHQSQATMVLLTVQLSKSTTSPDKHRQYALEMWTVVRQTMSEPIMAHNYKCG